MKLITNHIQYGKSLTHACLREDLACEQGTSEEDLSPK